MFLAQTCPKYSRSSEKTGMSADDVSSLATAQEGARTQRCRAPDPAKKIDELPAGEQAMRAAYLYLDATYESPGVAASAFGVERQHVNYYVRKLTSGGIERSEGSSPVLASPLPLTETLNETAGDQWSAYCKAYVFAHGLV